MTFTRKLHTGSTTKVVTYRTTEKLSYCCSCAVTLKTQCVSLLDPENSCGFCLFMYTCISIHTENYRLEETYENQLIIKLASVSRRVSL